MITENLIAGNKSAEGGNFLQATNPETQAILPEKFSLATASEIEIAAREAHNAWKITKSSKATDKAKLLRTIAIEIEGLGDTLVQRVMEESGLPEGRVKGERGRTCNQLRLFASLLEDGSWVDAVIDEAIPDRKPLPRVDLRKMSRAIGPVVVFTASNFPLAFSTAGGDTASALAAGCPVIVKAHPSHLGTNALVAQAITTAVEKCNFPKGTFSTLQGENEVGQELVKHPLIKAVGFTGSYSGGKALLDIANSRPEPIPVYAEMGSNNPIFILPEKLKADSEKLANDIAGSVNLGAGQFCTNPGILVLQNSSEATTFLETLKSSFGELNSSTMLNEGIHKGYNKGKEACFNTKGVITEYQVENEDGKWKGQPSFASVKAIDFLSNKSLQEEIFGPFTLVVLCEDPSEVLQVADNLAGQLTATIMATHEELIKSSDLLETLSEKAGRVIYNGVPTGVEVCPAMHHGGPFPAASNSLFTSVGTDAIKRFARPVAYQSIPDDLLPEALKQDNPLNIWRTVNGERTKK